MNCKKRSWCAAALASLLPCIGTACTGYGDETHVVERPSRDTFAPVSGVLVNRCGSLDCHGAPARNFRVYGVYGLRADGSSVTGNPDTTNEEVDATYESVTGIDPEALNRAMGGGEELTRWIVLSKGTEREAHVGGPRLPVESAGYRCIVSWVTGDEDSSSCEEDDFGPKPREGETW